ncbi:MAG TPA: DNA polymerase III subunit delta [Pyrinomonadaceae bacterium]|nr:DNA polymerase III subunit delta [Pyrinomonadaceae bacterium]
MAVLTREDLRAQLQRREIKPVYLLFGSETYIRDLALKVICDRSFAADELRDFNDTEFSLNTEGNLASALAAAEQLPMMASRRVIRITDVRVSASGIRDTLREDDEALLSAYFKRPAESSVVIFIADELDKRKRIAKVLLDNTTAVDFSALEDRELASWAADKVVEAGSEIDDRALRLLVKLVGPDVRRLMTEIQKLSTAALPHKVIGAELVEDLVANSREIPNFDLTDHLIAGRSKEALRVLKKILDDGSEPLALLGLISYNIRRLLAAKEAMAQGVDRAQVARIAKVRYSDQDAFMAAARRADLKRLTRAIKRLAETDVAIKTSVGGSGPTGSRLQIEMLVAELASP